MPLDLKYLRIIQQTNSPTYMKNMETTTSTKKIGNKEWMPLKAKDLMD